jgi:hypothetical protein
VASSYAGTDDVGGLSANTLVVDDGAGYSLTGSAPLTLRGPVGIAATGDGSSHDSPSTIAVPIALAGPQSWTIAGGYWAGLDLSGGISGPADSLHATLFDGTQLAFGGDSEVGAATFTGADSSDSGTAASSNGRITLDSGGALNASDGNPVALTDVELNGGGSLGGLTSTGSDLNVNSGVLQTNGATTLDSAGVLQLAVTADGTTPGTDFGQLSATGSIDLGGATLSLTNPGAVYPSACPSLTTGEVLTLVTTPATLSGTFTGVPDGQVVSEDCIGDEPTFTIHYTSHSVTATVVNPGPAPTTTSLSANPSSAVTGQPVTLTATVTSSSGAPAGSVLFGVGACGSAPLQQVGSSYTATCTANFAATDSPVSAQANFEPAGDTQDASVGSTTIDVAKAPTNVSFGTFVNGPADTVSVFAEYGSNTTPPVTGTVSVSVAGTPISSCQNLPVSTSQFDHGYASASCPAAGSTFGVAISYSGDANYAASSNAPAHPQTFPVTPSVPVAEAATLGISDIRARGGVVTGELSCTPRSGTACESVNVVLVARVTRQNGKVVAVAASKGRSKRHARTVQLGSATLQLNATSPTSLSLTLDSAAQKLLAARHSFTAELKVRAVGPWVATATSAPVSLSAAKPRKHHG